MKFLQDFINNKGIIVFLSIIVEKLVALINTIFVVRMITAEDYGLLTIIATLYGVFMTMNGLGSVQGLMRFGSIEKTKETRDQLANYIFKLGLKRHILLTIVFFLISMINELKYPSIWTIIIFFVIRMIGAYFYSFILSYYRIQNENNLFALIGIKINGIGLFITLILTYYLGVYGYLLGLVITPWLALLFLNRKIFIGHYALPLNYNSKTFWNYSLNSSITYFLSEMLFLIDVFLISLFLDELAVAQYKVAIILPMNLMFLPLIFMQTDYPKLSKNYQDKAYLLFYIKNYYKVFIPLCLLILLIGYLLKDWLLVFFFGQAYADNGQVLFVILIAVTMNMCFKNLYSNLLSAVGRAKSNSIVSIVSLVIMVALSLILIPIYGVLGAAIALAITFILTGFLSAYYFRNYLNSL